MEKSVVFLSSANIEQILLGHSWDSSAWDIANLFLMSVKAALLGEDAPRIVGMSEDQVCFVSADYFAETSPFADFVVHEGKRSTLGLEETRGRCSTSSTGSARRSRTHARPTRRSSNAEQPPATAGTSLPNMHERYVSPPRASIRRRLLRSSPPLRTHETAGR